MAVLALQLRAQRKIHNNRTLVHLFSSSSSDDKNDTPPSPPPVSSLLSEIRASLRQSPPPTPHRLSQSPPPSQSQSKFRSLSEIRENLSKFPAQTAPPLHPTTLQELYERNMARMGGEGVTSTSGGAGMEGTKVTADFESIRRSLRNFRPTETEKARGADRFNNNAFNPLSLDSYKQSLKIKPDANIAGTSSPVISVSGGSGSQTQTTAPPFSPGKGFKGKSDSKSELSKFLLLRYYKYEELGERLRKLRPANATIGKNCFSLSELKERLQKLREIEEKESVSSIGGLSFADLRLSLMSMHQDVEEKNKKSSAQRLDILEHLSGTPKHMLSPPKEQLVEKFFHPDNMSSAEKLKLELEKVREEFKMSESDCGSARVQVAQLTTKIKHLSSVLHKKDKHSRKGLQDMVQRRKKHLRYLRRTDWDSYCLCLSKLGLRDNPDYKN